MRHHIIYRRIRPWPAPKNHLAGRVCPTCGTTCHGWEGQDKMQKYHEDERDWRLGVIDILTELMKRTGMTEEQFVSRFGDEWSWGAEVTGTEDEAIEEGERA